MPRNKRWLALVLTVALSIMGLGLSASANSSMESEFLSKINASRSSAGLAPLSMNGSLQSYARSHSAKMADKGEIFHSTSDQLRAAAGSGWTKLGENVGKGPTVSDLHTAFMNSAGHRKNILGGYNQVGIGVVVEGNYIYVTEVFMMKGDAPAPTTTAPPPTTTAPAPTTTAPKSTGTTAKSTAPAKTAAPTTQAPTTTTSTLPPTTTTTLIVPPDKETTPGTNCIQANRFWQMCHD